jgi:hypothetical protein
MRQSFVGQTKKLSIVLEAGLHGRAKRMALMHDQTLTELIISLLEEKMASTLDSQPSLPPESRHPQA